MQEHETASQAAMWNGAAGRAWVEAQALMDAMYRPFEQRLVEAVDGGRVLDVGCGTGGTTIALAQRAGAALGVDISEPMVAAARARAERAGSPARFVCADAQAYAFEPASFDAVVSRFGVMFFDDAVQALRNLRRAACDGARMRLVVWRGADENPFMTTAERAAAPLLPRLPARVPGAPGQFAFADRGHVEALLRAGGWSGVAFEPLDVECTMPEAELVGYFTRLGPVGRALQEVDEAVRERVVAAVRTAFEPYVQGDLVRYVAACWQVDARA